MAMPPAASARAPVVFREEASWRLSIAVQAKRNKERAKRNGTRSKSFAQRRRRVSQYILVPSAPRFRYRCGHVVSSCEQHPPRYSMRTGRGGAVEHAINDPRGVGDTNAV